MKRFFSLKMSLLIVNWLKNIVAVLHMYSTFVLSSVDERYLKVYRLSDFLI